MATTCPPCCSPASPRLRGCDGGAAWGSDDADDRGEDRDGDDGACGRRPAERGVQERPPRHLPPGELDRGECDDNPGDYQGLTLRMRNSGPGCSPVGEKRATSSVCPNTCW